MLPFKNLQEISYYSHHLSVLSRANHLNVVFFPICSKLPLLSGDANKSPACNRRTRSKTTGSGRFEDQYDLSRRPVIRKCHVGLVAYENDWWKVIKVP